jgi:hypothetical protein
MKTDGRKPQELILLFYSGETEESLLGAIVVPKKEDALFNIEATLKLKLKHPIERWVLKYEESGAILKTWRKEEVRFINQPLHLN